MMAKIEMKIWEIVCQEYTRNQENKNNELREERNQKRIIYNDIKTDIRLIEGLKNETIKEMKEEDENMKKKTPKLTRRQKEVVKMEVEEEIGKMIRTRPISEEIKRKNVKKEQEE